MVIYETVGDVLNGKKLAMIKRVAGLFGEDKRSGLGDKIEAGESKEQMRIREASEESGLHVSRIEYHGSLEFLFKNTYKSIFVHVFSTTSFEGQLTESPKGILRWIDFDEIPYDEIWDDSRYWLPLLIEGKTSTENFTSIKSNHGDRLQA